MFISFKSIARLFIYKNSEFFIVYKFCEDFFIKEQISTMFHSKPTDQVCKVSPGQSLENRTREAELRLRSATDIARAGSMKTKILLQK